MRVHRLSILGVGLLGGSIGLAAKSSIKTEKITGYGHRRDTLDRAIESGAIDEATTDLSQAVQGSDLVILCTPVSLFPELLAGIADSLQPGAIVTDVGSTKRSIVRDAERLLPRTVHFVGSHPMAGSDKRGVEFARADMFNRALCILTPTPSTNQPALKSVDSFWQSLGMRTTHVTPDDHDRLVADVSHLPHAVAAALVAMQSEAALDLAAKGFMDATRIAAGDGGLWRDIFIDNRDNLRNGIVRLQETLATMLAKLDAKDGVSLKQWLDEAASRRQAWAAAKLRELNPD